MIMETMIVGCDCTFVGVERDLKGSRVVQMAFVCRPIQPSWSFRPSEVCVSLGNCSQSFRVM